LLREKGKGKKGKEGRKKKKNLSIFSPSFLKSAERQGRKGRQEAGT